MPLLSFSDPAAESFRAEVHDWLSEVDPPSWRELLHGSASEQKVIEIRRDWDRLVREAGYAGLTWPTAVGGRGLGPVEEFIFYEESAAFHAPDTLNFIGFNLAGPALIAFGTEDQQHRLLPKILSGEDLWCEGFSEPEAGSDLAAAKTTAERDGDTYVVWGQKVWTSIAQMADRCYLLVRTAPDAPRHRNLSVLMLDMHQPEIDVRPIRQITDEQEFNEVYFSGAKVNVTDRLGEENAGWHLATLGGFRQDRRIFDGQRRYVAIRTAVDQLKECSPNHMAQEVAELAQQLELLRWHVMRCVELRAAKRDIAAAVSVIKLYWSGLYQRVTQAGLGTRCGQHEQYWRREYLYARASTIAGGTAQLQRDVVARSVLGLPRK